MAQISQFCLPGGDLVYVEAEDPPQASGEARAALLTIGKYLNAEEGTEAAPSLADRVSPIIKALKVVREKLVEIGSPEEVELKAGIKFTGEAGVILSKYGAEASISIKLTWKNAGPAPLIETKPS